ncbi:MAG: S8 family serine peptidase [Verrucomicrobia bacterium]|nr:S8 family serine peptidase [Verrucomicrobiota bacterium]
MNRLLTKTRPVYRDAMLKRNERANKFRVRRFLGVVASLAILVCPLRAFGLDSAKFAEGELLVKLRTSPALSSSISPHARVGAQVIRTYPQTGWQLVRLPASKSVLQALAEYQQIGGVLDVEPNHRRRLLATPNDPNFSSQINLTRIGAPSAWNKFTGTSNVVVAVIDSGIYYPHEDLATNMWRNSGEIPGNGIDDDGNGYVDDVFGIDAHNHDADPLDDGGHGTACAGIIGAVGNNGKGIAGINWSVKLMALKYSGPDGFGYDADLVECFEYVIAMKQRGVNIRVTNNSYGGDENGAAVKDAIDAAGALGILNIFAAGNSSRDNDVTRFFPASWNSPSIISVAAANTDDSVAAFSNFGRTAVHLAAPGVNVWTTGLGQGAYSIFSGTSAATPHVAGAAALLAGFAPDLSAAELKAALLGSVDLIPAWTNRVIANGRLNIARALANLTVASNSPVFVNFVEPNGNRTPLNSVVSVTFTQPMDRASAEDAFTISPAVSGAFAWTNGDQTMKFTPAAPLAPAMDYTVKISGAATDVTGATLDGNLNRVAQGTPVDDFSWSFRTSPLNDDFAQARLITGAIGSATNNNRNATKQPGEPRHAGNAGGASIWFRWVCPQSGAATFDTAGTAFDTLLAIYVGTNVAALNLIAANDDTATNLNSRLEFSALVNATYFIAVDGKIFPDVNRDAPPMGEVILNWRLQTPPALSIRADILNEFQVSWPLTSKAFILQVAASLTSPVQWTNADATPVIAASQNLVTIRATNQPQFFRLKGL